MRVKLSPEFEPELYLGPEDFREFVAPENHFYGVPIDYFNIGEHNVTLQKEVTGEMDWVLKQVCGEQLNLTVPAQSITVDGEEIYIQPGFTGGLIDEEHVVAISPNNPTSASKSETGEAVN